MIIINYRNGLMVKFYPNYLTESELLELTVGNKYNLNGDI